MAEHDPVACMNSSSTWGTAGGCPYPQFAGLEPNVRLNLRVTRIRGQECL